MDGPVSSGLTTSFDAVHQGQQLGHHALLLGRKPREEASYPVVSAVPGQPLGTLGRPRYMPYAHVFPHICCKYLSVTRYVARGRPSPHMECLGEEGKKPLLRSRHATAEGCCTGSSNTKIELKTQVLKGALLKPQHNTVRKVLYIVINQQRIVSWSTLFSNSVSYHCIMAEAITASWLKYASRPLKSSKPPREDWKGRAVVFRKDSSQPTSPRDHPSHGIFQTKPSRHFSTGLDRASAQSSRSHR